MLRGSLALGFALLFLLQFHGRLDPAAQPIAGAPKVTVYKGPT